MKNYWVSWWHDHSAFGEFELNSPWWVSGGDMRDRESICAAVKAESPELAMFTIYASYDRKDILDETIEFRFVEERPDNWSPFSDRFQKADWMTWP